MGLVEPRWAFQLEMVMMVPPPAWPVVAHRTLKRSAGALTLTCSVSAQTLSQTASGSSKPPADA